MKSPCSDDVCLYLSRATPTQSKQPRSQSIMERTCFSYSVNVKAMGLTRTHRPSFGLTKDTNVCCLPLYLSLYLAKVSPPLLIFLFRDSFSEVNRGTLLESSKLFYHPVSISLDNAFKDNTANMLTGVKT